MANDDTVAACRAALLKACRQSNVHVGTATGASMETFVRVDDAAACMAEREARLMAELGAAGARNARSKVRETKLREALQHVADEVHAQVTVGSLAHLTFDHRTYWNQVEGVARAALAAAQERNDV